MVCVWCLLRSASTQPDTSSSQIRLVLRARDGALHAALTLISASSRLHPTTETICVWVLSLWVWARVCVCVCVLPGEMHSHRGDNLVHYVLWFAAVASGLWHRMLCHLLPTGFLMRVCDLDASFLTTVSFPLFTSVFSILITLFIALAWRNLLGQRGGGGLRTLEFLANNKAVWGWAWFVGSSRCHLHTQGFVQLTEGGVQKIICHIFF